MTTDTKVADLPELPMPDWKAKDGVSEGVYSAAQVRDFGMACYQAALARQEADKTKAEIWIEFAENGNIRFWTSDQDRAIEESFCHARSLTAYYAAPPAAQADDDDDWHLRGYAYASKQATTCAGCGEHKHTPLRIDAMGGYVCLTCIDNKLSSLLGEFGYTAAQAVDLEKFRKLEANWRRIADTHGVRQFSGNDHLLFANELRALIDQQAGKGVGP